MKAQITMDEYLKSQAKIFPTCQDCVCEKCLYFHSQRCPYGECYDDLRAKENPYDKAHPDKPLRTGWSNWNKPGEQAHWCRGGIIYPVSYCKDFVKFKGCQAKECLKCNVTLFQDGYIDCSLINTVGCEACYEEFEEKFEITIRKETNIWQQ